MSHDLRTSLISHNQDTILQTSQTDHCRYGVSQRPSFNDQYIPGQASTNYVEADVESLIEYPTNKRGWNGSWRLVIAIAVASALLIGADKILRRYFNPLAYKAPIVTPEGIQMLAVNDTMTSDDIVYSSVTGLLSGALPVDDDEVDLCRPYREDEKHNETCEGPPYLYLSFHGGVKLVSEDDTNIRNVCKYSRDGCSLGPVLRFAKKPEHINLRGMLLTENGTLLAGNAYRKGSEIYEFSDCLDELNGQRRELHVLVKSNEETNPELIHPYGMAIDEYLYVSTQGTNELLAYNMTTGEVVNTNKFPNGGHGLGVFFKVPDMSLRGVATDGHGHIYVADKVHGVYVLDKLGRILKVISIPQPIAIWYCESRDSVFIGCSKTHSIHEISISDDYNLRQKLKAPNLRHPAGITGHGDDLFVVSQRTRAILKFSMSRGEYVAEVVTGLKDDGEKMIMSSC